MPIPPDSVVSLALQMALLSDSNSHAVDGPQLDALCDAIAAVITATIKEGTVTTPPGVAVVVAFPAGTGATVAPGVGSIT